MDKCRFMTPSINSEVARLDCYGRNVSRSPYMFYVDSTTNASKVLILIGVIKIQTPRNGYFHKSKQRDA